MKLPHRLEDGTATTGIRENGSSREEKIDSSFSPTTRTFFATSATFRDLTRAKDETPSWGRLLHTLARSASLKLKRNGPLRSLRFLDRRQTIYALAIVKTGTIIMKKKLLCHHTDDDNDDNNNVMKKKKKKTQRGEFVFARCQPFISANFHAIF